MSATDDLCAALARETRLRIAAIRADRAPKHRHEYKRVGYGGAGWSLYRCDCGKEDIDA